MFSDAAIRITTKALFLDVTSEGGQKVTYQGIPQVSGGKLEMTNMTADNSTANFLLPADEIGKAIAE